MTDLENSPPRRPRKLLQEWLDDSEQQGYLTAGSIKVVPHEDDDRDDTGLVVMTLANMSSSAYFQPAKHDDPLWTATITGRGEDLKMNPHQVASLAAELVGSRQPVHVSAVAVT
ncbi:hypothetical protein ACO03V_15565 [Microbacterium sp. HMH0099]|uniref:hypothetical protein n=1 Tax=Microbacterium sp. HMH0099 TaxID=3414026 RepID=UPI003BF684BA